MGAFLDFALRLLAKSTGSYPLSVERVHSATLLTRSKHILRPAESASHEDFYSVFNLISKLGGEANSSAPVGLT